MTKVPCDPTGKVLGTTRMKPSSGELVARFPRAVDACCCPTGGAWVVGSDGGVKTFNGAPFHGSLADRPLNAPIVAIVPHGSGGYWLVGADGGIFAFGDAPVRLPYLTLLNIEYARGDRAIVAAEAYDIDDEETLVLIADEGATYIAGIP